MLESLTIPGKVGACCFRFKVVLAMQANRMADALLIAHLAGQEELLRVQQLYMKKQPSPYMRVVKAIQGNDFVSKFASCFASVVIAASQYMRISLSYHILHSLCYASHAPLSRFTIAYPGCGSICATNSSVQQTTKNNQPSGSCLTIPASQILYHKDWSKFSLEYKNVAWSSWL